MKNLKPFCLLFITFLCHPIEIFGQCVNPPDILSQPSDATICEGTTATLSVTAVGAASYQWYWSNSSFPDKSVPTASPWSGRTTNTLTIAAHNQAFAGEYWVKITNACGTITSNLVTLTVNPVPVITTQPSNVSVCESMTAIIEVEATEEANYQWHWSGSGYPNNDVPSGPWSGGQTNTLTISPTIFDLRGDYWVTVSNSCGSVTSDIVTLSVSNPPISASNNGPVCEGDPLELTGGDIPIFSYSWSGPNGFSSSSSNVIVSNSATEAMEGSYTLTATSGNCIITKTTYVTVNSNPEFTVSNNGPICAGNTLKLTGPSGMSSYSWTGPNGFTSSSQSPTVSTSGTAAMSGTYTLTATNSAGCMNSASTTATVNPQPVITSQPSDASKCENISFSLQVTADHATSYKWHWSESGFPDNDIPTGPWSGQNTNILTMDPSSRSLDGEYWATVSNDCGSVDSRHATISFWSPPSGASNNGPICEGETLELSGNNFSNAEFLWTGPNGFTRNTSSVTISDATPAMSGTYTYTATLSGGECVTIGTTTVTVNTKPNFTVTNSGPACEGNALGLTGPSGMSSYSWTGPNGFTSASQNPTVSTNATATMSGTYALTATNSSGCANSASTTATVNPQPVIASQPSDGSKCENISFSLQVAADHATGYKWHWSESGFPDNDVPTGPWSGDYTSVLTMNPTSRSLNGEYWVTVSNACGSVDSRRASVSFWSPPSGATNNGPVCEGETLEVSGTDFTGGSFTWEGPNGFTSSNSSVSIPDATPGMSGVYTYTAVLGGGECVTTGKTTVTVTPSVTPSVHILANRASFCTGQQAVFTAPSAGGGSAPSYQWKVNGQNVSGAAEREYTVSDLSHGDNVSVQLTSSAACAIPMVVESDPMAVVIDNCVAINYIKTRTPLIKTFIESTVLGLTSDNVQLSTAYFDGLGRNVQQVDWQSSPTYGDIVQPIVYDEYGRMREEYLPYVSSENNGSYKSDPVGGGIAAPASYQNSPQYQFYNNNDTDAREVVDDPSPYAVKKFEPSPLNRVLEQGAPGAVWQPTSANSADNKTIKYNHRTNYNYEVRNWTYAYASTGNPFGSISSEGFYELSGNVGLLYATETYDEENRRVIEYKNKQDQLVLKKVQEAGADQLPGYQSGEYDDPTKDKHQGWACTYYIYDDFGNLRFVLPPQMVEEIKDDWSVSQTDLDKWAFQYDYDERQRMTAKKVPGAEAVYMVYDDRDRLVLTQDGNTRDPAYGGAANKWIFTKYDQLNRPVLTGDYEHDEILDQNGMQQFIKDELEAETYDWYETGGAAVHGYSNGAFPDVADEGKYLTVIYYDNYDFPDQAEVAFAERDLIDKDGDGEADTHFSFVKGQATGTKTLVLDGNNDQWLISATYYDDRHQAIQTVSTNLLGGKDRVSVKYDFTGKVLEELFEHTTNIETVTVRKEYAYDHAGRLLRLYHQIGGETAPKILLAENKYNELGELIEKNIHQEPNSSDYLQSIDYRYNIRGWLENINTPNLASDSNSNEDTGQPDDIFGMELLYENPIE